jgi:hypothetical protein
LQFISLKSFVKYYQEQQRGGLFEIVRCSQHIYTFIYIVRRSRCHFFLSFSTPALLFLFSGRREVAKLLRQENQQRDYFAVLVGKKYRDRRMRRIYIHTSSNQHCLYKGWIDANLSGALTQFAPSRAHFYLPAGILKGAKKQYAPSAANLLFACVNTTDSVAVQRRRSVKFLSSSTYMLQNKYFRRPLSLCRYIYI